MSTLDAIEKRQREKQAREPRKIILKTERSRYNTHWHFAQPYKSMVQEVRGMVLAGVSQVPNSDQKVDDLWTVLKHEYQFVLKVLTTIPKAESAFQLAKKKIRKILGLWKYIEWQKQTVIYEPDLSNRYMETPEQKKRLGLTVEDCFTVEFPYSFALFLFKFHRRVNKINFGHPATLQRALEEKYGSYLYEMDRKKFLDLDRELEDKKHNKLQTPQSGSSESSRKRGFSRMANDREFSWSDISFF